MIRVHHDTYVGEWRDGSEHYENALPQRLLCTMDEVGRLVRVKRYLCPQKAETQSLEGQPIFLTCPVGSPVGVQGFHTQALASNASQSFQELRGWHNEMATSGYSWVLMIINLLCITMLSM